MSDIVRTLRDFKNNLIQFLDELIEQFPTETDFIIGRVFLKDRISSEVMMNGFIKEVVPLKKMILERDEKFFLESNISLFNGFDKNKVNHFKTLWRSSLLDEDDREIMWQWFSTFLLLAEQYQKLKSESTL